MKLEPVYCDMHIHTYPDANRRIGYKYNASSLVDKVLLHAKGHKALISLTDHNTINKEAYNDIISSGNESIALIVGVELHVRSNGIRPYHAHAYFDADPSDGQFIDEINAVLDELYDDKLPSKENENIPTLPELLNSFRSYSFLFLPHGGQSHSTFDNALSENELCDDLMMRSAYYNTFDGFTARSGSNVGKTKKYFEKLGISEFTNLLTGSDNYCPERYPEPKAEDAEGFSPTWIYADASFDGLRLALSESSRLFYDVTPPESFAVTAPSIERVTLANDLIDIDIDLMPGLNVVIGSSSTGKTLLLEALARSTGALRLEDGNSFYNKFEIDDIVVARNDQTIPYYINQSYISKVVDKSVNRETIDGIRILKDVFPRDDDAARNLDAKFNQVRSLVIELFNAAELIQSESEALGRLRSTVDLLVSGSINGNPVSLMKPSKTQWQEQLRWKQATETKVEEALDLLLEDFKSNPLLDSIDSDVEAIRRAIAKAKQITSFSDNVYEILKEYENKYTRAEKQIKTEDAQKTQDFASVLDHISALRSALESFEKAKMDLVTQRFTTVPKEAYLAGHHLGVSYEFEISPEALVEEINSHLNSEWRLASINEITPDALVLSHVDGRKQIGSMGSFAESVSNGLSKRKKRVFAITTKSGSNWDELSEGRKTAVLLDLILSFKGNTAPLLIDQPEDNLASDYINSGLADAIRGSKETRQTIIVTHNATIPMLADAQAIILCRNEDGKLIVRSAPLEGRIDGERMLDWIADVTDGGRSSVQKRFRKYNFRKFGE